MNFCSVDLLIKTKLPCIETLKMNLKSNYIYIHVNQMYALQKCLHNIFFFFFFKKFLADTCPFLGPLVPLFWISGDVSSGFQSQSGFCLIRYFCGGECNVHSPRFTSGATLADLLAAGHFPTCMYRGGTWLGFERAIARTEDERATIVPATRLYLHNILIHRVNREIGEQWAKHKSEKKRTLLKTCLLKFFCRTHSHVLFWGHWYPCFGIFGDDRVGSVLLALWRQM